jgi:excisionase family DNA binding protein
LLTVRQASTALGMSPTFVRDEYHAGRLRGYRFGRAIRFDPADVEAYRRPPQPPAPPPVNTRELRELRRLMERAGWRPEEWIPADQLALIEGRYRNMRMPPWASGAAIREIYAEAKRLTAETGVEHHVDHVIPLQGPNVSGLHVETNLQILSATANIGKGNKFAPC